MKSIALFFTLYWIVYFPTCIAYNDLPGFSSIDEGMTLLLIVFTFFQILKTYTISEPWREYFIFLGILAFYVVYSLIRQVNVPNAVGVELVQQIRPYSIIYCTWILNPHFTEKQKQWMLGSMIITLASWIVLHPETTQRNAEFPVLGQLAISTGTAYYLFTEERTRNSYIALLLVLTGMLAPKYKFMGQVVCFIALIFFLKKKLNFRSPNTLIIIGALVAIVIAVVWKRFDDYYFTGWDNEALARPMTYKTSLQVLWDYFPLGPGMGTFASWAAGEYYSPLYYKYELDHIWGLQPHFYYFVADAFYPTLAQYGVVGVILFCMFWKRRLTIISEINDMRYYRVAFMAFFCLAIEQTADTSFLSGKGMGYCMLLGLCMNANHNKEEEYEEDEDEDEDEDEEDDDDYDDEDEEYEDEDKNENELKYDEERV